MLYPCVQVFQQLAALNKAYKEKHGFIFIVCASGKSAVEMLAAIKQRLPNTPYEGVSWSDSFTCNMPLLAMAGSVRS